MEREILTACVADAIKREPEQADITIDTLSYVFNDLKNKSYSFEQVCSLIMEAVENTDSDNPDVEFIRAWLNSIPTNTDMPDAANESGDLSIFIQ